MPFILIVEVLVFILVLLVIGVWLLNQPDLFRQIIQYSEQLSLGQLEPQIAEEILLNLFKNPVVLNGSIFIIAFLVPLIEEFFKPMALWFLAGRKLTPSQGFVGGLIAGACFATLETLGAIGSPTDTSWFFLLIGRMGTGLLHVTLSGLVGWGLASAFYNRNWGRFLGNYFSAVLIHGLWNLFALLSGITPLLPFSDDIGNLPIFLSQLGPFVLLSLALINVNILLRSNRKLQQTTT
jgi:RsiW-degrading membrane proteinase PrsW (M82 family)